MRKRSAWLTAVAAAGVLALPSPEPLRAQESGEEATVSDPGEVGGLLGVFFPGTGEEDEEDSAESAGPAESEDATGPADSEVAEEGAAPDEAAPADATAAEEAATPEEPAVPEETVAGEPVMPQETAPSGEIAAEEPGASDEAAPVGDTAEDVATPGEDVPPAETVTGDPAAPERTGPAGAVADGPGTRESPELPSTGEVPVTGEPPVPLLGEEREERDDAPPRASLGREESPAWPREAPPAPAEDPEDAPAAAARPEAVPVPTPDLDADLRASRRPREEAPVDPDSIRLPTEEIHGEIEKPDIFFLLPKARSRSDEQLIRSRIRREITRPLIKDWLEEELLLK